MDRCYKREITDNVVEHVAFTRNNNYHSHQAIRSGHAPVIITDFDSPFVALLFTCSQKALHYLASISFDFDRT
jgi:hypothetical protein